MPEGPASRLSGKVLMTKEDARRIRKLDFIPGGKPVDINTLRFRRTDSTEILHCCRQTSDDDIQSGPIYCGDIAEYVAPTEGGAVALCERHSPPNHLLVEPKLSF